MIHEPRPSPAKLKQHNCKIGHRYSIVDPAEKKTCVDCGAHYRPETNKWLPVYGWTQQRPLCKANQP